MRSSWRSPHDLGCTILALALGLGIGYVRLHTVDSPETIMALLGSGILLGVLQPAAAWRWALLLVVGLPITAGIARVAHVWTPFPADLYIPLFQLAFAIAGTYGGALLRRGVALIFFEDRSSRGRSDRAP